MSVLQTEAGFVSLCHFSAIQTQQVIVGENLHTVVMSRKGAEKAATSYTYLRLANVLLFEYTTFFPNVSLHCDV